MDGRSQKALSCGPLYQPLRPFGSLRFQATGSIIYLKKLELPVASIYEAPNEEIAAKVSMISLATGALEAQSLTAIPYKRFLELTKEI